MREEHLGYLVCPACGGGFAGITAYQADGPEGISAGSLVCGGCAEWYRVEDGVIDLLPAGLRDPARRLAFARRWNLPVPDAVVTAGDSDKIRQIEFFRDEVAEYESKIVASSFYRALDEVHLGAWMTTAITPDAVVLEVGTGTGRQLIELATRCTLVVGLDISEEMIRVARAKLVERGLAGRALLVLGDGESPPVRGDRFDACLIYGTLHHLPDPGAAIASAGTRLRPGGSLYTLDPHRTPLRPIFDLMMKVWKLYEEEARSEPLIAESQLAQWLRDAGLNAEIRISTYLPPHLLYPLPSSVNRWLLRVSDAVLQRIPGFRRLGGVIEAIGTRPLTSRGSAM